MLEEIKQFETRLENQILKTNLLEKELYRLKQENVSLITEFKLQLNNIKLTINNNSNNKDTNMLNSKSNSGRMKPQTTNISKIFHGNITVAEKSPDNLNLDFNVLRDIVPAVLTPYLQL